MTRRKRASAPTSAPTATATKKRAGAGSRAGNGRGFRLGVSLRDLDRALLAILVLSAFLRFWGIADRLPDASLGINVIDDTAIEETDRTTIMRSWAMWQGGMKPLDLNPHTGGWPALSFYLTLVIQFVYKAWYGFLHAGVSAEDFAKHVQTDSAGLFLLARVINAMIGIASVALTWRLALPLVGRTGAIVAAIVVALNPLHILTSQHVSDPNLLALVFVALAVRATARVADGAGTRDSLLAGVWIGLAAACKYVPLVLLLPLALAHVRGRRWKALGLAAAVAVAAMFVASPFTFLDWKTTTDAFGVQRRSLFSDWVGQSAFPISLPTYLVASFPRALGWPVYALTVVGLVALWRRGGGARSAALAAVVVVAANGLLRTAQERYLLVVVPVFAAAAGAGLLAILEWARGRLPEAARDPRAAVALATLAALAPVQDLVSVRDALRRPDSRHEARRWVNTNVSPMKRLAVELYGPVFSDRERNIVIWPFFATQASLVASAYRPEFLDGVEAIVLSGEISRRFVADSLKYPAEAAYYRWLGSHGDVLWRSDRAGEKLSGPLIEVRSLPTRISTREERDSLFAALVPTPTQTYRLALWCHDMALLFSRVGMSDRAEEWARRGLRVNAASLNPRLYAALSLAQLNMGDFLGAEESARRGLALAPNSYAHHLYRGMALEQLGRLPEALPELQQALTLSGDPRVHLNIAQVYSKMGKVEEAVAELAAVPAGIPERAAARRDMAVLLLNNLGRREEGIAALKEAASLTSDAGEARLLHDEVARLEREASSKATVKR